MKQVEGGRKDSHFYDLLFYYNLSILLYILHFYKIFQNGSNYSTKLIFTLIYFGKEFHMKQDFLFRILIFPLFPN